MQTILCAEVCCPRRWINQNSVHLSVSIGLKRIEWEALRQKVSFPGGGDFGRPHPTGIWMVRSRAREQLEYASLCIVVTCAGIKDLRFEVDFSVPGDGFRQRRARFQQVIANICNGCELIGQNDNAATCCWFPRYVTGVAL